MRATVTFAVLALLLLPILSLVAGGNSIQIPLTREVGEVFAFTALQATLSALAAIFFGILGGLGLIWAAGQLSARAHRWLEAIVFLPNAAPVLLLLLATLKFFPWAKGLTGIVFVHTILNVGLVSVAFAQLVRLKIAGPAELAYIEGSSGAQFFFRGAWPILRADLALLFLFLFAICFASFAVPLMIGGSRATTVEVLIYQTARINADWSMTLGLASLQMLAIFVLSLLMRQGSSPVAFRAARTPILNWAPGLVIALAPALLLGLGLFTGLINGIKQLRGLADFQLADLVTGSLLVGTGTGLLVAFLLLVLAYARPTGWLRKVLVGYAAPSSVLIGFGLLLMWRDLGLASYAKIALGLTFISLPAFYRYQWDALLNSFDGQVIAARTLGANDEQIFARVIFPQVIEPACRLAGLAALWAWGDFALSSLIAERTLTVPMAVQGLMNSYRFDAATALTWILVLGGSLTFAFFTGAGYVFGQKSQA